MSRDTDEEWSGQYDSTWEEEGEEEPRGRKEPEPRRQYKPARRWWNRAARDLQNYRHGYELDSGYQHLPVCRSEHTPNLDFYQNKKRFEPNGFLIDDLLKDWKDDYITLERNHCYIQWLFPLQECGMNCYAKPLTKREIQVMKKDEQVRRRFLAAYKLMLAFYGIKLVDKETGEVARASNWEERFKNLHYHSHNNLRITRILKCLGELGYERFQAPLVRFFLEETLCKDKLQNVKRSALDYFMFTVKDKKERRKLVHFAWENYKPQEKFIWGPVDKLRTYKPPPPETKQEARVSQSEKKEESDDDTKTNGYVNSCRDETEEDDRDYPDSKNRNYTADSFKFDKKSFKELIPLSDKIEAKDKLPVRGSSRCSKAICEDTDVSSSNADDSTNGTQLSTQDVQSKLDETRNAPSEASFEKESKVLTPEGNEDKRTEEAKNEVDGVVSTNQNENIQQDNSHKDIAKIPAGTPRKRKRVTNSSDCDESRGTASPIESDNCSKPTKEGSEGCGMSRVDDQVKKPKSDMQQSPEDSQKLDEEKKCPEEPEGQSPSKDDLQDSGEETCSPPAPQ